MEQRDLDRLHSALRQLMELPGWRMLMDEVKRLETLRIEQMLQLNKPEGVTDQYFIGWVEALRHIHTGIPRAVEAHEQRKIIERAKAEQPARAPIGSPFAPEANPTDSANP